MRLRRKVLPLWILTMPWQMDASRLLIRGTSILIPFWRRLISTASAGAACASSLIPCSVSASPVFRPFSIPHAAILISSMTAMMPFSEDICRHRIRKRWWTCRHQCGIIMRMSASPRTEMRIVLALLMRRATMFPPIRFWCCSTIISSNIRDGTGQPSATLQQRICWIG